MKLLIHNLEMILFPIAVLRRIRASFLVQVLLGILIAAKTSHSQDLTALAKTLPSSYFYYAKLLQDSPRFSATQQFVVRGSTNQLLLSCKRQLSIMPRKIATELIAEDFSPLIPAENLSALKRIGMNRHVTVVMLDEKSICYFFPDANVYLVESLPEKTLKDAETRSNTTVLEKTFVAYEEVSGFKCRKYRVTARQFDRTEEGLLWLASDLGDFPVQMTHTEGTETITETFSNINTNEPPAALFQIPTNAVRALDKRESISIATEKWREKLIEKAKGR